MYQHVRVSISRQCYCAGNSNATLQALRGLYTVQCSAVQCSAVQLFFFLLFCSGPCLLFGYRALVSTVNAPLSSTQCNAEDALLAAAATFAGIRADQMLLAPLSLLLPALPLEALPTLCTGTAVHSNVRCSSKSPPLIQAPFRMR